MSISVRDLFEKCGLSSAGVVRWRRQIPFDEPGIYVVASTAELDDSVGSLPRYEPDPVAFQSLREVCPDVAVDGMPADDNQLAARIRGFWIPDAAVLYIGLAGTSLRKRVNQYYATRLGQRSPHAGGWWIKTLSELDGLYVHYAKNQ